MRGLRASVIPAAAVLLAAASPVAGDAVSAFFVRPELRETRAIVVLQDGVPVVERYGAGYDLGKTQDEGLSPVRQASGRLVRAFPKLP